MDESIIRRDIYRMMRYRYGLWPDHFPDIPGVKEAGRPDLIVMNPWGSGYYVEVKSMNLKRSTSFSFSDIYDSQRRWLSMWESLRPFGSWLGMGVYGDGPRSMYLIPWPEWLAVEERVSPYQNSLPWRVGPGYKTELQDECLDFRLLREYKMLRISPDKRFEMESGWIVPESVEDVWKN